MRLGSSGGVGVEPGRPARVWIEARGETLTANVGGKRQATLEADDFTGAVKAILDAEQRP